MNAGADLDTTLCPLCGAANDCAVAAGDDPSTCWCMTATMDPDALARIPPAAQGRVCICPRCAAGSTENGTVPFSEG